MSRLAEECYHVPVSPGQKVCACLDHVMFLRLLVELQARHIANLERQLQHAEPALIRIEAS